MHLQTSNTYTQQHLSQLAARYHLNPEHLKLVGTSDSYVYEGERDGHAYILKISHSIRRTPDQIMGELDWLNYLADHGVSVARAVPSAEGNLVETVPSGADKTYFLGICYERAPGRRIEPQHWGEELFETWGRLLGKMHRLTTEYEPSNPAYKRYEWYEDEMLDTAKHVPADQTLVLEQAKKVIARVRSLPTDRTTYGMVHNDLHSGNYHWQDGVITVFDFDGCGYHWFAYDVAIVLYNAMWFPRVPYEDKREFARWFLTVFLKGYEQEYHLERQWLAHFHDFLKLRHVEIYAVLNVFDPKDLTEGERENISKFRREIEQGLNIVDIDFTQLAL